MAGEIWSSDSMLSLVWRERERESEGERERESKRDLINPINRGVEERDELYEFQSSTPGVMTRSGLDYFPSVFLRCRFPAFI